MKKTTPRFAPLLLAAVTLAGCGMIPPVSSAPPAPAASTEPTISEAWATLAARDESLVKSGQLPKEVLTYDRQIGALLPEAEELLVSHDPAKSRAWSEKMRTLIEARNKPIIEAQAKLVALSAASKPASNGTSSNDCLSPMGKNICDNRSTTTPGSGVNYGAGSGGLGASMGGLTIGPGGIGVNLGQ